MNPSKLARLTFIFALLWASFLTHASARQPNIILFYTDEMQHSDLGCYGGEIPTPAFDRLAKDGMIFSHAYACSSMCTPSRYGVLTGTFPGRCRSEHFMEAFPTNEPYSIGWNTNIDGSQVTLPRVLKKAGYTTGMIGKWHLGNENFDEETGIHFDADADLDDANVNQKLEDLHHAWCEKIKGDAGFDYADKVIYLNNDNHPVKGLHKHHFAWQSKGAEEFIETHSKSEKPFFLYFASTAIHGPNHREGLTENNRYTPEGIVDGLDDYDINKRAVWQTVKNMPAGQAMRYVGAVQLDHQLELIQEQLVKLGIADDTAIIYMADHNIEPGKATCFEQGTHVPMIVKWPGVVESASTCKSLISNLDVFSTIASLVGVDEGVNTDGVDQSETFINPQTKSREYVYTESGYSRSISDGQMKYIALRYPQSILEQMKNGQLSYAPNYLNRKGQAHSQIAMSSFPSYFEPDQLYHLQADPYEQVNLANRPEFKAVLEQLKRELAKHLSSFDHPFDLSIDPFYFSGQYEELAAATLASVDLDRISWLKRDHGTIHWPPSQ